MYRLASTTVFDGLQTIDLHLDNDTYTIVLYNSNGSERCRKEYSRWGIAFPVYADIVQGFLTGDCTERHIQALFDFGGV